jgi:hypothetical protein
MRRGAKERSFAEKSAAPAKKAFLEVAGCASS